MRRVVMPLLAALLALAPPAPAQQPAAAPRLPDGPRVQVVQIQGRLAAARPAVVLLPADYQTGERRYPVLYLLHGLWGGHPDWIGRTNLMAHTAGLPLIVVMPDAGDSWYSNSVSDPAQAFEDYVARDVVEFVDAHFRTLPYREARFIAGLSMGGFGAIKLATKNPRAFSLAASFSGAFGLLERTGVESVEQVFGPPGSEARRANDVVALLRQADAATLPYFYLDCGTADRLLQGNRAVAAVLSERALPYEYHEVAGAHTWEYWDRRLPHVLRLVAERIGGAAP